MPRTTLESADRVERHLRALLVRALDGDATAYRAFLEDLATHVRAFVRNRLGRHPDFVEDVVQEVLLAVHKQRVTYRRGEPLTAWVHAIARYKMVDFLREHATHEALHEPLDDESQIFAASDQEAGEARRDVTKLLEALPDRHRLPIVHVKLEGLSVAEAAQVTGMSESAIKVGVHRGMKALVARMRGEK